MSHISSQRVTQRSIAKRAGVAQATVALILSGHPQGHRCAAETRRRVLEVAREMNYRPNQAARLLGGKRTRLLGMLIGGRPIPVLSDLLWDLEETAAQRGYRLMVTQVHGDEADVLDAAADFAARGVDGLLLHGGMAGLAVAEKRLPSFQHVVWCGGVVNKRYPYVQVDLADGVGQAVEHLLARGRARIGLSLMAPTDFTMVRRREGYEAALARRQRPVDPALIWVRQRSGGDPPDEQEVEDLIDALVVAQRADGIVAVNDAWAVPLMRALARRGIRVPEDVAVVGYDNEAISRASTPLLTTIDQQNRQVAATAMELMIDQLDGAAQPHKSVIVRPKLIVRESS